MGRIRMLSDDRARGVPGNQKNAIHSEQLEGWLCHPPRGDGRVQGWEAGAAVRSGRRDVPPVRGLLDVRLKEAVGDTVRRPGASGAWPVLTSWGPVYPDHAGSLIRMGMGSTEDDFCFHQRSSLVSQLRSL